MADGQDTGFKTDLLETVLEVIHGQRGQNVNELVSLLALSNLLGIISFLNTQDINLGIKSSSSKAGMSELKELATSVLGSMGGSGDKKINPAMLINLMKTLSAAEGSSEEPKTAKIDEKSKKQN